MCCWNLSSTSFSLNLSSGEFHVHPSYISRPWLPIHMSKYVTFSFSVLLAKGPSNIRVVYCRNDLYASGKFVELHDSDGGANPDVAISVASCGSFGSGISLTPCYNSLLLFDSRHSDTTVWSDSSTDSSSRERRDRQAKAVIRERCSREDERVRLSWAREWRRPYCCLATTTVKGGDHNTEEMTGEWIFNQNNALILYTGFSAEPALPAFCRLAFGFAGLDENLVAFCRLESFVGFRFCQLEIIVPL